ncbi:putative quinol monooxygenase [Ideonella sp.]|uniref:putative quinol monooxygenase n=1 Tax=Ideonella sp. TaxID=1929293 RepID=UPI0035AF9EC1
MLVPIVHQTTASGRAIELEAAALRQLVAHASTKVGVPFYGAAKLQQQPDTFMLCEYYADRAAFDNHLAQPAVKVLLRSFDSLIASTPQLTFCDSPGCSGLSRGH